MRRIVASYLCALTLSLVSVASVFAESNDQACPPSGRDFGQHIASMAPEHPREYGQMFGQMVSDMARGIEVH